MMGAEQDLDTDALMKKYVKHALFEDTKIIVSHHLIKKYQNSYDYKFFISYLEKICYNIDPKLLTRLMNIYERFELLDRFYKVINLLVNRQKIRAMVMESTAHWNWDKINYLESFKIHTVDGMKDYYFEYFYNLVSKHFKLHRNKRRSNPSFKDLSISEWCSLQIDTLFKDYTPFKLRINAVVDNLDDFTKALELKISFILNNYEFGQSELLSIFEDAFQSYRLSTVPLLLANYPHNMPFICHLKLFPSQSESHILKHLSSTLSPIVSTKSCLLSYLSTFLVFRLLKLNPSPLILLFQPILIHRQDLITSIVDFLFSQDPLVLSMHQPVNFSDESLLLNIIQLFGDKSLFLKEYQKSLSTTLLSSTNVVEDVTKMQQTLSHLGETCLKSCDDMLCDILNSTAFTKQLPVIDDTISFNVKLLTQRFWPNVEYMSCSFNDSIKPLFKQAEQVYHDKEPHKLLVWSLASSTITLELDYNNSCKNFTVLLIQGLILLSFNEIQQEWSLEELSQHLKVKPSVVKKYSNIWITNGIMHWKKNLLILGKSDSKEIVMLEQIIAITPQLKIAMTMMRSIIRTRTKAQVGEIEIAAKKSMVFKQFKHSVQEILQIMVKEKMITYKDGYYRIK
eukprot:NODE_978_length_2617_cov_0.200159.p1 type:complete len:623 gc:universal NODE_978_length_2617_cov_0.200159:361-2229(+)